MPQRLAMFDFACLKMRSGRQWALEFIDKAPDIGVELSLADEEDLTSAVNNPENFFIDGAHDLRRLFLELVRRAPDSAVSKIAAVNAKARHFSLESRVRLVPPESAREFYPVPNGRMVHRLDLTAPSFAGDYFDWIDVLSGKVRANEPFLLGVENRSFYIPDAQNFKHAELIAAVAERAVASGISLAIGAGEQLNGGHISVVTIFRAIQAVNEPDGEKVKMERAKWHGIGEILLCAFGRHGLGMTVSSETIRFVVQKTERDDDAPAPVKREPGGVGAKGSTACADNDVCWPAWTDMPSGLIQGAFSFAFSAAVFNPAMAFL